jgi:hypothetical protein
MKPIPNQQSKHKKQGASDDESSFVAYIVADLLLHQCEKLSCISLPTIVENACLCDWQYHP